MKNFISTLAVSLKLGYDAVSPPKNYLLPFAYKLLFTGLLFLFTPFFVKGQTCTPDVTTVNVTLDAAGDLVFTQPGQIQNDTGAECCDGTAGGNVDCAAIQLALPAGIDASCLYSQIDFMNDQGNIYIGFVDATNACFGVTQYGNNSIVSNVNCDGGDLAITICKPGNLTVQPTVDVGFKCDVNISAPTAQSICDVADIPTLNVTLTPTEFETAGGSFAASSNRPECGDCSDFMNNLSDITVTDSGAITDVCDGTQTLTRTFMATYCGKTLTATQVFTATGNDCPGCCVFEATCGASDLGTYDCSTIADIPTIPTVMTAPSGDITIDNATGDYGIDVGDTPCGTIIVAVEDTPATPTDACGLADYTVTRTITIIDDEDDSGDFTAGEESMDCVYTYMIEVDTDPPEFANCPVVGADPTDLGCNPEATDFPTDAELITMVGVSDACGIMDANITVASSDFAVGCVITRTYVITAVDDCGNENTCNVLYQFIMDNDPPTAANCFVDGNDPEDLDCNPQPAAFPGDNELITMANIQDGCGVVTPNIDVNFIDAVEGCVTIRTYTVLATDDCNNVSSSCNMVYQFSMDNAPPLIAIPADENLPCSLTPPTAPATVAVTDNCDVDTTAPLSDTQISGNCREGFTAVFTYGPVTDACGNTAPAQSFTITTTPCGCTDDTSIEMCDDNDPCTVNDIETLACDGSVCVPCAGELIGPPVPSLTCPVELNKCATDGSNIFDCMFEDTNGVTQVLGSEANPIIGGANPNVVSNAGIIDASVLNVGTYSFTLSYEAPPGCISEPVTCTFTVINPKSANAGSFPRN